MVVMKEGSMIISHVMDYGHDHINVIDLIGRTIGHYDHLQIHDVIMSI